MTKTINKSCLLVLAVIFLLAGPVSAQDTTEEKPVTNPFAGREDLVAPGKTQFNIHCSHCHGPNAFQGERPRDLRRLSRRYKDNMAAVFYKTVINGRPEKGMPPWKGVLEDEELWIIYTFLETVQKK